MDTDLKENEKYPVNNVDDKYPKTEDDKTKTSKCKSVPFWSENPNILFDKEYIFEFFPVESMGYEQKLNSITRAVIILTIVGLCLSDKVRILLVSAITLFSIYLMHYYHTEEKKKASSKKVTFAENYENRSEQYMRENNITIPKDVFMEPDSDNPFSNVLVTDYDYNPHKKPAPPAFNKNVNDNILIQAKELVKNANPDQPDIADKLFKDLGEQFVFEQSLRPFNSTPNTTIPNDQGAFAEFCYGSMVSCKEGNSFACARNLSRYTN